MNLIDTLYDLLKAREELDNVVENIDDLVDLDKAIDRLCKVLGLSRRHLEEGSY